MMDDIFFELAWKLVIESILSLQSLFKMNKHICDVLITWDRSRAVSRLLVSFLHLFDPS